MNVWQVAPSRGRGLKLATEQLSGYVDNVAPSRGRGLKLTASHPVQSRRCRPFTGAWIETQSQRIQPGNFRVAPSRGRGLKLKTGDGQSPSGASPLHGGVD